MAAPFSLLAFQDIITSVSGILIFTTLLLALDLTERDLSRRPDATGGDAELARAVAEAEARRDAMAARLAEAGSRAEDAVRRLRPDAPRQVEALAGAVADAEAEVSALEETAREASREKTQAEDQATGRSEDRERLRRQLEDLARLRQELQALRDPRRVAYAFDDQARRQGWLVEVDGDRIAAAPLDRPARPQVFDASGLFGDRAAAAFLDWSRARPASERYFLLVVRPSGRDRYDAISEAFRRDDVPFGFDLIAPGQHVLDPQRGAFQP
jgi:hypothetical protein